MLQFTVQGKSYVIPDLDDLTTDELREIKKYTGMGLKSLSEGFQDMDPDAIVAVVYVAKRRAGEDLKWSDLDNLKPMKDVEWPEVDEDGNPLDEAADDVPPTKPRTRSTGKTQKAASSST